MREDDELPDHDYASIYGPEALDARRRAHADAQWQRILAQQAVLEGQIQALRERLTGH